MCYYLLHRQLDRCFAVSEFRFDAWSLDLRHYIMQPLRLLQHLSVATTKLP